MNAVSPVSVVIASYRRPDQLATCLAGLREQTRPADEVVVVVQEADAETQASVQRLAHIWPALRVVRTDRLGSVAAYNCGLAAATGEIVAYIDDDAVPTPEWIAQIAARYADDDGVLAVGGRDIVIRPDGTIDDDRPPRHRTPAELPVGRIQWFGRMIANHHLGTGPQRDVDVLKGVNMSFRRAAVTPHGFDERLLGRGTQLHSELSICLPLRRTGGRIVYDPNIRVFHYPAPRPHGDVRDRFVRDAVAAAAHNEALAVLDYLPAPRRVVYALYGVALGSTDAPGVVVLGRDLKRRRPAAWSRFTAAQRGRAQAWRTRRRRRKVVA